MTGPAWFLNQTGAAMQANGDPIIAPAKIITPEAMKVAAIREAITEVDRRLAVLKSQSDHLRAARQVLVRDLTAAQMAEKMARDAC